MSCKTTYTQSSHLLQDLSSLAQSSSGIYDIINDDGLFALDISNQMHTSYLSCSFPLLYYHSQ